MATRLEPPPEHSAKIQRWWPDAAKALCRDPKIGANATITMQA
jgi:hypothetical protein